MKSRRRRLAKHRRRLRIRMDRLNWNLYHALRAYARIECSVVPATCDC